ncbi:MAG: hypothetical protein K0S08_771 [Gammaproteobacteria bacterium]|jgi:hypothetical protein|nr:hypothetical protein [Gammaproteobacteria bacterium]
MESSLYNRASHNGGESIKTKSHSKCAICKAFIDNCRCFWFENIDDGACFEIKGVKIQKGCIFICNFSERFTNGGLVLIKDGTKGKMYIRKYIKHDGNIDLIASDSTYPVVKPDKNISIVACVMGIEQYFR